MKEVSRTNAEIEAVELEGQSMAELRARLREAEETLDAIRNGEVDAVVVGGPGGQQVYTLENADRPYRVLIEQMQEGAVTLSEDGTVLYCNQRFATIVGAPRETIIGHGMSRFLIARQSDGFRDRLAEGASGSSAEFTLQNASGAEIPVNISLVDLKVDPGLSRVVCGVVTDLTHNRRRSDELAAANERLASEIEEKRRTEDRLQLTLDAAGMGSWDLDLVADEARRSLRHDQIFGYTRQQEHWGLQRTLSHFVPEDRNAAAAAFTLAKTTGTLEFEGSIRASEDDAIRRIHLKGRTYFDAGKPVRIAGVVADVTEQRQVEEQLRQAQKMEAIGQLTGGIAHDFNNLLMVIGGSLDILSDRMPSDEKARRMFELARQGVARGAMLNEQLLAFARRQDLRIDAVCVNELIPRFENLLDRAVGEMITVKFERAPHVWLCRTDPHQLETAILNLAINARDAMPEGGVLTLATENRTVGMEGAAAWGGSAGDYVVISVADDGIGMPQEVMARAFEPFFTTKGVGKGTGLGLSQVYGFAKQSGGFVTLESERGGRGTTVSIHLPRTSQSTSKSQDTPAPLADAGGQGIVLVVEDDADVRAIASSMLQNLGYRIREAENARAALALIEIEPFVDLVFTDIIMPEGMTGIDLARELRVRRPELPVLLTSGYSAQGPLDKELPSDLDLLRKPYAQRDLSAAIKKAMAIRPLVAGVN